VSPVSVSSIGEYIRQQREQAKISLRQLASAAGVSNPYLSQIERGLRRPSAEILQQIAKGLRISAEALYVQAGIPPAEVLRIATWNGARLAGLAGETGSIATGKRADMILVDGDPTKNIRDLDKLATVIKSGSVYDPAAIEKALGIAPRQAQP